MAPRWCKCPCGPPNRRTLSRRDLGCPPCIAEDRPRLADFKFITETVTYVYQKLPENSLSPARTSATAQRAQRTPNSYIGRFVRWVVTKAVSVGISRAPRR